MLNHLNVFGTANATRSSAYNVRFTAAHVTRLITVMATTKRFTADLTAADIGLETGNGMSRTTATVAPLLH